jgi:integrase
MPKKKSPPKYRRHKARDLAVVTIEGRDHYLGPFGSVESHEAYERKIAEWRQRRATVPCPLQRPDPPGTPGGNGFATNGPVTINEVILPYLEHSSTYYRKKNGEPTGELDNIRYALKAVKNLYGRTPAVRFDVEALEVVRGAMIDADLARTTINGRVCRIRRMFRWAAKKKLVPTTVYADLQTLEDLKIGRSAAREPKGVKPVPEEHVRSTVEHLNPHVAAMVQVQLLACMRPQDIRNLRTYDLDMTGDVWVYTCWTHKTEHHGQVRRIAIGPRAQAILKPFLKPNDPTAFVFSPKEAVRDLNARRRKKPTPRQAQRRKLKENGRPGDQYPQRSYGCAVARACKKAGVPHWHPHQLRHTSSTKIRSRYGLDVSTIVLGHQHGVTSEIYADADFREAVDVMREIG